MKWEKFLPKKNFLPEIFTKKSFCYSESDLLVLRSAQTQPQLIYIKKGSGCSTAVERTSHDREIMGSYPARCWAFFSSLFHQ